MHGMAELHYVTGAAHTILPLPWKLVGGAFP